MLSASRQTIARCTALGIAGFLLGVLTGGPASAGSSATTPSAAPARGAAQAPAAPPLVAAWAARIEQRATEIQNAPKVTATRIGYGAVVKKGDGGVIEAVLPALELPDATGAETLPGLPPVEAAPPVVIRVRSPLADRVGKVARRLIELGHLPADQWTDSFEEPLETAVRAFQIVEGLQPDGKVGEVTRQALDRTPAQTVAMLRRAVATMRAQAASIPETAVLVNLPAQTVTYIERGRPAFTMRAVVGRPSRKTPLLQDKITSVTINPTWTVPPTVLTEDKLPVLRKKGNTGIKNAVVYLDGVEVVTQNVNWWSVDPGRIRIVQKPGDDNALGRFRFNLTNGDGIFLHGTNDPRLFSRDLRAASSGCVRLEDARLMADTLLTAAKMSDAAVTKQLDTGDTKTVRLPNAIPVRFVYWNASVDGAGTVRVHPDIYEDPPAVPSATPAPSQSAPQTQPAASPRPVSKPAPLPIPAQSPPAQSMPGHTSALSPASVRSLPVPPPTPTRM
ncbi:L,D-transpeptidase family protein [Azospirillum agricola]|uniref:L,D-transpeptidase family protein n=1 Tax=Azospirillum agricola TaxID=1720247 RepID=UPI000A0F10D1|nr:L,D-transpeptidase family protein [Azospirillum agricola]SMH48204.1 Putative peptidoglycan binding domain-containing protein [Azospirillum lipoferum]